MEKGKIKKMFVAMLRKLTCLTVNWVKFNNNKKHSVAGNLWKYVLKVLKMPWHGRTNLVKILQITVNEVKKRLLIKSHKFKWNAALKNGRQVIETNLDNLHHPLVVYKMQKIK